jgi:hypothetical protein
MAVRLWSAAASIRDAALVKERPRACGLPRPLVTPANGWLSTLRSGYFRTPKNVSKPWKIDLSALRFMVKSSLNHFLKGVFYDKNYTGAVERLG